MTTPASETWTADLGLQSRAAALTPGTAKDEDRSVDVVWSTGARRRRLMFRGWDEVVEVEEELSLEPGHVRLERLQAGVSVLANHRTGGFDTPLSGVLGTTVPGTAKVANGEGTCRIRLSARDSVADVWRDVQDGVLWVCAADLPRRPQQDDTVVIAGQTYTIWEVRPDGAGGLTLALHAHTPPAGGAAW